ARPVVPHQTLVAEVVHDGEYLAVGQHLGRDAVQLREIERLDLEPLQRAGEALLDVPPVVAGHPGKLAAAPELGGNEDAGLVPEGADPALALAAAIDVGGVPEIDLELAGGAEDFLRRLLADGAEVTAQLPGAEADFADFVAGLAENACV